MQKLFLENVCLSAKFDLRVKKKQEIFLMQFQNKLEKILGHHQKNASHSISIYGNCMMNIFFKKQKKTMVFSSPDCFIRIKPPQKLV